MAVDRAISVRMHGRPLSVPDSPRTPHEAIGHSFFATKAGRTSAYTLTFRERRLPDHLRSAKETANSLGVNFLESEFDRCRLMLRKSDRLLKAAQIRETKVLDACRALQLFTLCTEATIILGKNVDSPQSAAIRNKSEALAGRYEIKCAPRDCDRKQIVEDLFTCFSSSPVSNNCSLTLKHNATSLAEPCLTEVLKGHPCSRKVDVVYVAREAFITKVQAHKRDCSMLRSQYRHCSHTEFAGFLQKCYESFLREVTGKSIATPKFCRLYHRYGSCVDEASAETSCFNATGMQAPYETSLHNFTSKYSEVCTQYTRSRGSSGSLPSQHHHDPQDKAVESAGEGLTSTKTSRTVVFCLAVLAAAFLLSPYAFQIRL